MKKLFLIVLVVVMSLALVVFVGCKKGDAPKDDPALEQVAEEEAVDAVDEAADAAPAAEKAQ